MSYCSASALFKSFWDWRMREFPEFATFAGVHDYDGKLESYTLESIKNRKDTVEKYLKDASQLASDPNLSNEDNMNLQYFIGDLNIFQNGQKFKGYYFPLSYQDGVQVEYARLLSTMNQKTEDDYLKILERLSNLPCKISEIIAIMKDGIKNKMTFHSISISGVLKQVDLLQQATEKTVFYKPFASISDDTTFSLNTKDDIQKRAKKVIEDGVLPSFKELKKFLENEYFKHLRPEIAISSLVDGKEYYQGCLDFHLTCSMTPEEVHKKGLAEVERISKKMEKIIESLELKMSLKEFLEHMRGEDDFSFKNVEELLDAYKGAVFNQIEPKLHKLFNYSPKGKLLIERTPSSLPNAPGAFYYAGTIDGSKPGTFVINAYNLKASPKYNVMSLALHEAMPGHHLQCSFMIESENMPDFRRIVEDRRYTEFPTCFPLHTAYCEGWALYCEYLGYELGLYDDVYLEYGYLSNEMLRACRLVVDTGMHALGWSRDKAVDYMLSHTAFQRSEVENEVNRYITWPGQACAYKIGELKIKALREQAEKALGSKFDIRKFHDVVLQSFGPLDILDKRISDFIKECDS